MEKPQSWLMVEVRVLSSVWSQLSRGQGKQTKGSPILSSNQFSGRPNETANIRFTACPSLEASAKYSSI